MNDAVRELLEQDAIDWPDGHPCRDCNRLYKDHAPQPDKLCDGWR